MKYCTKNLNLTNYKQLNSYFSRSDWRSKIEQLMVQHQSGMLQLSQCRRLTWKMIYAKYSNNTNSAQHIRLVTSYRFKAVVLHLWEWWSCKWEWSVAQNNTLTLLRNLSHHMLTYLTNHNHLKTVLIIKTTNVWGTVSHVWVKVTTLFKTNAVVGIGLARGKGFLFFACSST